LVVVELAFGADERDELGAAALIDGGPQLSHVERRTHGSRSIDDHAERLSAAIRLAPLRQQRAGTTNL
jgi:hypothetical protein